MRQRVAIIAGFATLVVASMQTVCGQAPSQQRAMVPVTAEISAHYLAVAESAAASPKERALWQRRLDTSRDTLENVLGWYTNSGHGDEALRLLVALSRFRTGPSLVGGFDKALAIPGTQPMIRARALNSASAAAFRLKDQERTRRWANESIAIWRSLGNSAETGRAYERLVQAALRDDNHAALRALADSGDMLCVQGHDEDCHAYFLNMRGESARVLKPGHPSQHRLHVARLGPNRRSTPALPGRVGAGGGGRKPILLSANAGRSRIFRCRRGQRRERGKAIRCVRCITRSASRSS